jgi:Rps23 Pro-64 3,4-dihydroxylase Tpa1-like proline 4-hydroxylase
MHAELEATCEDWDRHEDYFDNGYHFRHKNIYDQSTFPPLCRALQINVLESEATRTFMTQLTGRDCSSPTVSGAPSYYAAGDHSLPHTDHIGQRTVAYVWHLAKEWKPEWGGALYWAPYPLANAFHHASFNTLVLFSVTPHSVRTL